MDIGVILKLIPWSFVSDIVIEVAPEDLNLKQILFVELDEICAKHTILSTNTSTISVT